MVSALAASGVAAAVLVALSIVTWSTYSPWMMGRDGGHGMTVDALATQVGAIVSAGSTAYILVRSLGAKEKQFRRHPNPLLFWKAAVDGVYALLLCAQTLHVRLGPAALAAALNQSTLYTSECWFVLISYDLYACGTNPFQNTAFSIKWYHAIAWSVGGVAGLASYPYFVATATATDASTEHASDLIDATEWTLGMFYIYVTICVLCACVFLVLENQSRPPVGGIKDALRTRSSMLHASRTFTILYGVYQFVTIVLWISLAVSEWSVSGGRAHIAFNVLVGARGFMDLVTWHVINSRSFVMHSTSQPLPSRSVSGANDAFLDGVSLNPEFNVALRKEVLHFTTRGIVAASLSTSESLTKAPSTSRHRRIQLNLHELGMDLRFDSYYPHLFRDIRHGYRLDEATYRESFLSTCHERVGHGGSSGAFMFYTADYLFLVKTITKAERRVLLKMLPAYIAYLKQHPGTHLTRYYGCHAIHMYRQKFYFVVMSNAMGQVSMHQSFDLKGSWVNRHAKTTPPGAPEACTYCGVAYPSGSRQPCNLSIHGIHLPHRVLKDNDLQRKLQLAPSTAHAVVTQLAQDSDFLRDQGITDYSLLLSVHTTQFRVDADSVHLTPSSRHQRRQSHQRSFGSTHTPVSAYANSALCFPTDSHATTITSTHVYSFLGTPSGYSSHDHSALEQPGNSPSVASFHRSCRYSVHDDDDEDGDVTTPLAASYRKSSLDFGTFERAAKDLPASPWIGTRDVTKPGYKASAVVGPDFYTLGIVDLLQTWTWQKRVERWWKVYVLRLDARGISAAAPAPYAARFQTKMRDIMLAMGGDPHRLDEYSQGRDVAAKIIATKDTT